MPNDLKVVPLPHLGPSGVAVSTDPHRGRDGLEVRHLQVVARPHLLNAERHIGCLPVGLTLAEIVQECYRRGDVPATMRTGAIVQVNGEIVPRDRWHLIRPKAAANVCVSVSLGGGGGGGGKNPMAAVLTIAVIVAAIYTGWLVGAAFGSFLGVSEATGTALATFAFATIGTFAVNAMFPARPAAMSGLTSQSYNDSPTYSITGAQNQANPYGPIPVILGRHRFTPPLGARTYTEIIGNDEYLRMLFIWGYGPLKIEDIKIGDTPISSYSGVEIETREGRPGDAPISLIPEQVTQDGVGVTLLQQNWWVARTSKKDADELSVDISFPRGLVRYNNNGGRDALTVVVEAQYRPVGTADWSSINSIVVTDAYVGTLRKGVRWKVARGQYEVRLRRVTTDTDDSQTVDEVQWSYLRSIRNEHPIKFPKPLAMTAIRIRATEQLQGVINNLNGIVTSYAPDWNGTAWVEAPTNNPASLVRLCHTGPFNARPRTLAQIDSDNLAEFHDFCRTNGYKFNMARDFTAGVWDTVADICSAARAAPTIIDGRRGVIMDKPDKPVVQHFTPRNSWGFQGEINFVDLPDALRVKFVNEDNGFIDDERIVCNDGFTEATAVNFETAQFPGITDPDLIWKFGRYHLAQPKLRPETISFYADFENLVCTRGDLIRVGHDVPKWGAGWGRVKSIVTTGDDEIGYTTAGVVLDEAVIMDAGTPYACRFRLSNGHSFVASIENDPGETRELAFQAPVPLEQGPRKGDLAMFGPAERETVELLVKAITPGENLSAKIICVDKAPEIYSADTGPIPAHDPKITNGPDLTKFKPPLPVITGIQTGTSALVFNPSGGFRARVLVNVQSVGGSPKTANIEVRVKLSGSSQWRSVSQAVDRPVIAIEDVYDGEVYDIQARAESIYGVFSAWTAVQTVTVDGLSEPPSDPTGFACNIIDGNAYLSWDASTDLDVRQGGGYGQVRWSPELSEASWAASVAVVKKVSVPATSIIVPAMVGTYLFKWFDSSGNPSVNAAVVSTSIAGVQGLNFVEMLSQDDGAWSGVGEGVTYAADLGGIALDAAGDLYDADDLYDITDLFQYGGLVPEGRFYLGRIDLGGVFTSRLTASLSVGAVNFSSDLYAADDLYALGNLYDAAEGQYSAVIEVSTTQSDPANPGAVWTSPAPAMVGDNTAWAYDVWVRLIGSSPAISPVVYRSSIAIDMADRVVGFSADIPATGGNVAFAPAFFVTPKLGLAIVNGQEGDSYTISNESPSGFDIAFTNAGTPVARSLTGVARAYGARSA